MPRPFLFRDGTTDSPLAAYERNKDMNLDTLDMEVLGCNASIGYTDIKAKGPCRPLEFPAPIVDRGMTCSSSYRLSSTAQVI